MPRKKHVERSRRRRKMRVEPGAPPGTIKLDPRAPAPFVRVIGFGPEGYVEETVTDIAALESLRGRWPIVWINVDGVGDPDMLQQLGTLFSLHPLAIEDVVHLGQRAKVDPYDSHLFIVLGMPSEHADGYTEQVGLFLGDDFVLTFQERAGDCLEPVRERIRHGRGRIRRSGADYLAYAVIDAVVDAYFPVLEQLGERLESLEDQILTSPDPRTPETIQAIRAELRAIRHANLPHRDVLTVLLRPDTAFVEDSTRVYLRDSLDHAVRVSETVDGYREESSDLMHAHLSSLSNRMNEVMKVLTVMAAIFIPLSFVAGVYGMNFDQDVSPWNMPELRWRWGYPAVLLFMLSVMVGLVVYFKRKKWI